MVANINEGLWEEGFYTNVNENFYTITYVGDSSDPTIRLIPGGVIPTEEKITAQFGTEFIGLDFYRSLAGEITRVPYLSALLDTLYYQDGTNANKVGQKEQEARMSRSGKAQRQDELLIPDSQCQWPLCFGLCWRRQHGGVEAKKERQKQKTPQVSQVDEPEGCTYALFFRKEVKRRLARLWLPHARTAYCLPVGR